MSNKKKTSFWGFIKNHTIEIPIIQRDYAQGRKGKEDLRKNFLTRIRKTLDSNHGEQMILDFVYGSENEHILNPLDGQQRLTTLWLLHWYIALRSGNLDDLTCDILNNFTYETRISSRKFCKELCVKQNFEDYDSGGIVEYIKSRTWFYSFWEQDPTIQAMLRMLKGTILTKDEKKKEVPEYLDGIEQVFDNDFDFKNGWKTLTESDCPIFFYYLPLNEFKLTDDLYLKMNARGKQLSSFENYKAELSKYISDSQWVDLSDVQSGLIIKIDTTWTNVFWNNHSKEYSIDEIYFAFINRFFLNELFKAKDGDNHLLKAGKAEGTNTVENKNGSYRYLYDPDNATSYGDSMIAFSSLDPYKYFHGTIPKESLETLVSILDNYSSFCEAGNQIPKCKWAEDFHFIPEYLTDDKGAELKIKNNKEEEVYRTTSLSQVERIAFYALCKYFSAGIGDEKSLEQWMRIVWNLISSSGKDGRPQIRTTQAMLDAMDIIELIDSHGAYNFLKTMDRPGNTSDIKRRLNEEIDKVLQIVDGNNRSDGHTWEEVIMEAENYSFFKGTIDFLYHDDSGNIDWSKFDEKFVTAKKYFPGNDANVEMYEFAKLFSEDALYREWNSTLTFSNSDNLWKYVLSKDEYRNQVHKFLMSVTSNSIPRALEDIIDIISACKNRELWILGGWNSCDHVLTNYLQRRNYTPYGYVYQIAGKRNDILYKLENEADIKISYSDNTVGAKYYEVNDKRYYRGLVVYLTYDQHLFAFYGNNKVYLMKDQNNKDDFSTDKNHFIVQEDYTVETIKNKLNDIIVCKESVASEIVANQK